MFPTIASLLRQTITQWRRHGTSLIAAGLSYYTVLAFGPIMLIIFYLADAILGQDVALARIHEVLQRSFSPSISKALIGLVDMMVRSAPGFLTNLIGAGTLTFAATSAFVYLQEALNRIWGLGKHKGGIKGILVDRASAFVMVLGFGLMLFVLAAINAVLSFLSAVYGDPLFLAWLELWQVVYYGLALAVLTGLFASLYKFLPETRIAWGDVLWGALFSATVWTAGIALLGLFFRHSRIASAYGAAGSFIILLVFVFVSAQVFLFGAEFTHVYAYRRGSRAREGRVREPDPDGDA